jgi:hypothetical protein
MKQRDLMRQLFQEHGGAEGPVLRAYAEAEQRGRVARDSNLYDRTPEQYAKALFNDGVRKGWITSPVRQHDAE